MDRFLNGDIIDVSILVGTNLICRGHDFSSVRYVIIYDTPDNIETYIHCIGCIGRTGENCYAMTFLTEGDYQLAQPLIEVLEETKQPVPDRLRQLAEGDVIVIRKDYGTGTSTSSTTFSPS